MTERVLGVGVIGLSRAFALMIQTFVLDPRVRLVAACDTREEARLAFERDFGGHSFIDADELCADPAVDVVYIASPHPLHATHTLTAIKHRKHVLVEKPMGISIAECQSMIQAAELAGVHLIVGHSHSFDLPIRHARSLITRGDLGQVRMINSFNYTDFLYRPRRPEELDTSKGGGVVFSQGAHQIDMVRLLGGGLLRTVRAITGSWDPSRPTEGAFSALLSFADGAHATVVYSGYGHFDSDELLGWRGELGHLKSPDDYGAARTALARSTDEIIQKNARAYGSTSERMQFKNLRKPDAHQHFGSVIVSCDHGDLRPLPTGVMIYGDFERRFDVLPAPQASRKEVIDEVYGAIVYDQHPAHNGRWSLATLEVCLAILESAEHRRDVSLQHQVTYESAN